MKFVTTVTIVHVAEVASAAWKAGATYVELLKEAVEEVGIEGVVAVTRFDTRLVKEGKGSK